MLRITSDRSDIQGRIHNWRNSPFTGYHVNWFLIDVRKEKVFLDASIAISFRSMNALCRLPSSKYDYLSLPLLWSQVQERRFSIWNWFPTFLIQPDRINGIDIRYNHYKSCLNPRVRLHIPPWAQQWLLIIVIMKKYEKIPLAACTIITSGHP